MLFLKKKEIGIGYEDSKEQYVICQDLPTVTDTAANFEYAIQYPAEPCRILIAIKIYHYIFTNVLTAFGHDF